MGDAPKRVQRCRTKGFKLPPNTVCVTRPGKWGNPFPVWQMHGGWWVMERDMSKGTLRFETENEERAEAVRLFRATLTEAEKFEIRRDLRGKNLACFCSLGVSCHASVLLEIANGAT